MKCGNLQKGIYNTANVSERIIKMAKKRTVEGSKFLRTVKPVLKELLGILLDRYEYASILAVDSESKIYSVTASGINLGDFGMLCNRGFVIKVYEKGEYAEYSFNKLDDDVKEQAERIIAQIETLRKAVPDKIEKIKLLMLDDEPMEFVKNTEYEINPFEMGAQNIIDKLTDLRQRGLKADERMLDCGTRMSCQKYSKLFLSKNKDMEQNVLWTDCAMSFVARKGSEVKSYFTSASNLGGAEVLDKLSDAIPHSVEMTVALLDSEPIVPGEYECICTPEVTGMIVHEAFGHGVEMDMFAKKRALAEKYVGEYVASPLVNMHDGAAVGDEVASYFFDDDGVVAKDTIVIENGVLKQGISDTMAAMRLNTEPTGNSRRESYRRKAYTRMTNTYFEAGNDKLEDMIASISDGYLLENATSGMEDPKNWGIQCLVNMAREIKDGKLTGRVCSPIVLTGYVPDLLKSISMVSDDFELRGSGFCGKGYKEFVKVSDGGPYIKAKIRLG